ncbi:MAG: hypothetical protein ACM3UP_02495 [Methanocella sp.]
MRRPAVLAALLCLVAAGFALAPVPIAAAESTAGISEAASAARAGHLMKVIIDWRQAGKGRVVYYLDGFWRKLGPEVTLNRLTAYITKEDGVVKPIRTGREVAFYNRLKGRIAVHQVTEPIGMDQLLVMGLEACRDERDTVNLQEALLTVHNVMRLLARPQQWSSQGVEGDYGHPASDPAYPILQDYLGLSSSDAGRTLAEIMGIKRRPSGEIFLPLAPMEIMFDPRDGDFQAQPGAVDAEWNSGSHYYYWIGALARTTMGSGAIMAGVVGELRAKKGQGHKEQGEVEISQFVAGSMFGSEAFKEREGLLRRPDGRKAEVSATIANVRKEASPGYRRWDFDRVFTERNGVGVNFTYAETWLDSPVEEVTKYQKFDAVFRLEPGKSVARPGYLWVRGNPPKYTEASLRGTLRAVLHGKDDNGNDVTVEVVFTGD